MRSIALNLISLYQLLLSPRSGGLLLVLGVTGSCKYEITCSEYTKQQIAKYGILKGSLNGIRRIISCR